ncbi:ArnT family glycosyltransferase [Lacunimicrobium album]
MFSKFSSSRFDYLWIGLFAGLLIFFNLGTAKLFDEDEPKNAECGREMFERGDWIVPTFNYELRTDKPIMIYWLMLCSFNVFGVSEFAARLPSALMALGTMCSIYVIARHLFDRTTGLVAACALGSCLMYVTIARASTPDSTLIFFIVLSLAMYVVWSLPKSLNGLSESEGGPAVHGWVAQQQDASPSAINSTSNPHSPLQWPAKYLPRQNWQYLAMYAVMGCAVLSKGPVGFLLPCTIIGLTLLWLGYLERTQTSPSTVKTSLLKSTQNYLIALLSVFSPIAFGKAVLSMRVWWLVLSLAVVALPWYVAVGIATDGAWLEGFLGGHNVGRFLKPMEQHSGPFFYYIPVVLMGFFPWSAFLPLAMVEGAMEIRNWKLEIGRSKNLVGYVFLLSWVLVYICFFSVAQTKLPNYVLPCYPALAVLTSALLVRWTRGEMVLSAKYISWGAYTWIAAGIGLMVGLTVAGGVILQGTYWLGLLGLVPLAGGLILLWQERQPAYLSDLKLGRLPAVIATAGLFVLAAINLAADPISQQQDGPHYGELSQQLAGESRELGTFEFFSPNLVFYGEKQVARIKDVDHLTRFLSENPGGMVLTRSDKYELYKNDLPPDIIIADRRPRFLRQHDLLLLIHRSSEVAKSEVLSVIR